MHKKHGSLQIVMLYFQKSQNLKKIPKSPRPANLTSFVTIYFSAWQNSSLFSMQWLRLKNGPSLPLGEQLCGLLQSEILFSVSGLRISVLHVCHALNAQIFHRLLVPWQCHQHFKWEISCHFLIFCQRYVCHQSLLLIRLPHLPDLAKSHNSRSF